MSRDLPSVLGLGLPSANGGLFVMGLADCLHVRTQIFHRAPIKGGSLSGSIVLLSIITVSSCVLHMACPP